MAGCAVLLVEGRAVLPKQKWRSDQENRTRRGTPLDECHGNNSMSTTSRKIRASAGVYQEHTPPSLIRPVKALSLSM